MTNIRMFLLIAITAFGTVSFSQVHNSVTNQDYEECLEYATECTYTPSKKNIDKLIEKVMRAVGTVRAGTFTDPHHLGALKGDPADPGYTPTYIKNYDGVIEFASSSENCKLGKKKGVNCRDLIEYWLIKYDREKKLKDKRTFEVRVVIYEYDTKKENGYRLGFGGVARGDANIDGARAPRASLVNNSADNFLGSLFSLNLGNLTSSILSLNLNLGNLGNYLSTYNSYVVEMKADKYRSLSLEVEKKFANVVSPENVNEEIGLFFSGKITPDGGDSNRIRIENGGLRYGRASNPDNNDDFSFSLTKQINLSGFSTFELDVELGKPKMLFDINTLKIGKERGKGLFFFNNKQVSEHVNLVGVLYVTEKITRSEPTLASKFSSKVEDLDFETIFGPQSIDLYYDPILAYTLGTNIEDLNKKEGGTASRGYKVKPYRLKLNPLVNIPDQYLGQMVRIETSSSSSVNIMGESGSEIVSLRQLISEGHYLGFEPKGEGVRISPLELQLKFTLEQLNLFKQANWTNANNSNQVVFNMVHFATSSDVDSMKLELETYNHIPWRK